MVSMDHHASWARGTASVDRKHSRACSMSIGKESGAQFLQLCLNTSTNTAVVERGQQRNYLINSTLVAKTVTERPPRPSP